MVARALAVILTSGTRAEMALLFRERMVAPPKITVLVVVVEPLRLALTHHQQVMAVPVGMVSSQVLRVRLFIGRVGVVEGAALPLLLAGLVAGARERPLEQQLQEQQTQAVGVVARYGLEPRALAVRV